MLFIGLYFILYLLIAHWLNWDRYWSEDDQWMLDWEDDYIQISISLVGSKVSIPRLSQ
jgi:hypothetical protein